ncbi:Chemotaxis protein CheW [Methylophilaceae bacterium]|nr:Chemotaxis protein CheW [Methylophilaceae bacterium]
MLFMQFKIDDDRYVIEAKDIIEIVPFANLKRIPKAPPYVAGLLNYRGDTVPVIDVCFLMSEKLCEFKLSSRIALVNYKDDEGKLVCLGLLIEHLTETVRFDEKDFSNSGVALKDNPYLGKVVIDNNCIVQMVNIRKIIPEEAREILFNGSYSG